MKFRQNKENRLFAISSLTICIFFLWNANSQKNKNTKKERKKERRKREREREREKETQRKEDGYEKGKIDVQWLSIPTF